MNFELSHTFKNPNVFSVIHSPKKSIIKKTNKKVKKQNKKNIENISKNTQIDDNVLSDYDIIDTTSNSSI